MTQQEFNSKANGVGFITLLVVLFVFIFHAEGCGRKTEAKFKMEQLVRSRVTNDTGRIIGIRWVDKENGWDRGIWQYQVKTHPGWTFDAYGYELEMLPEAQ